MRCWRGGVQEEWCRGAEMTGRLTSAAGRVHRRRNLHWDGKGWRMWVDRRLNWGRENVDAFLRALGKRGVEKVLDLGAGWGDDLRAARRYFPAAELHAVEWDEAKCDVLVGEGFIVHRLDIERARLPFRDEEIDLVIANQILEHVKEIFWIFHELRRALRVGGWLIIGVPNLAAAHNRLLLLLGRQPTVLKVGSAHVRGYTWHGLREFLNEVFPRGWRPLGLRGANFYPFPPQLARLLARWLPGLAWGFTVALEKSKPYGGEFLDYVRAERLETNFYTGESWEDGLSR